MSNLFVVKSADVKYTQVDTTVATRMGEPSHLLPGQQRRTRLTGPLVIVVLPLVIVGLTNTSVARG